MANKKTKREREKMAASSPKPAVQTKSVPQAKPSSAVKAVETAVKKPTVPEPIFKKVEETPVVGTYTGKLKLALIILIAAIIGAVAGVFLVKPSMSALCGKGAAVTHYFGGFTGGRFALRCAITALIALAVIMFYMAARFRKLKGFKAGISTALAVVYNFVIVFAAFALFGVDMGEVFLVVMMATMAVTAYEAITVFDRVRENREAMPREDLVKVVNISCGQLIGRAMKMIVISVLLLAVFVIVAGAWDFIGFMLPTAFALIFGMLSSLFVVPSIWVSLNNKK